MSAPTSHSLLPRWLCAAALMLALAGCGAGNDFSHGDPEALALVHKAQGFAAAGNNHRAFELLAKARQDAPHSFEVEFEYGVAAVRTERLALGIAAFEKLLTAEPENLAVARWLASSGLAGGFLDHAAAPIEQLVARADATGADYTQASQLAFERGDMQAALTWAQKAVVADPEDTNADWQLSRVLVERDDSGAQAALEHTLEINPGQARARFALGTLLLQAGDEEAGLRQLKLRDSILSLYDKQLIALPAKARIERLRQIVRALPNWSKPFQEIARAQLELGQPKKAQDSLRQAERLQPETLDLAELNYAAALARGQQKEADKWLQIWKRQTGRTD